MDDLIVEFEMIMVIAWAAIRNGPNLPLDVPTSTGRVKADLLKFHSVSKENPGIPMHAPKNFCLAVAMQVARLVIGLMMLSPSVPSTIAQAVTLAPGDNSSLQVNTSGPNAGLVNWTVDGFNLLDPSQGGLQWLYYSTGGGTTPQGIQAIGPASSSVVEYSSADSAQFATTYGTSTSPLSLQIAYTLTGGRLGSGDSEVQEAITVQNQTLTALGFHFFQYVNLNMPVTPISPSVQLDAINAKVSRFITWHKPVRETLLWENMSMAL